MGIGGLGRIATTVLGEDSGLEADDELLDGDTPLDLAALAVALRLALPSCIRCARRIVAFVWSWNVEAAGLTGSG
jgi:hypothetical protein